MLHIKKIKPLFTTVITTGDRYAEDMYDNGIITFKKGELKFYQKVVAIGSMVRDIQVGDTVMIDPINYMVRRYDKNSLQNDIDNNPVIKLNFNWVTLDDENGNPKDCLMLNDRDIKFVFEGEETNDKIIVPDKPKIIVN